MNTEATTYEVEERTNRLIDEKSPYLLQHARNPVDWYPWGDEAFERAASEDKPVFLSIGYSTCHWCHVMERESFEDPEVAELMNKAFINIKVDREERPDIDGVYMTACQMLGGRGGWPLTIIMTPDKKPFYAATYLPRDTVFGRMGMTDLVPRIEQIWRTDRAKIDNVAGQVVAELNRPGVECSSGAPGETNTRAAYEQLSQMFDPLHGGFAEAPKFPTPHNLLFLMRHWKRTGDQEALKMVEKTLTSMFLSGMYDQVGFGFHRYSTDRTWLVPHFEKMLYDQALLIMAYAEAYQITGRGLYARAAREVIAYLLRDMSSPEGAFYSAEDADSEGVEGKFYLWSEAEIREVLADEADLFIKLYNIEKAGNFREESTGELTGDNIPHLRETPAILAPGLGMDSAELDAKIEDMRARLFEHREKRTHPYKDDKVLTDWNGLAIAALAKAARALGAPEYALAAGKAARFFLDNMRDKDGRLLHRYRDGEAAIPGFLDDYAFMVWGLIELYEATFETEYLAVAADLNRAMAELFKDPVQGGFYLAAEGQADAVARHKDAYDGAIPSGNSVAAMNLARLSLITGDAELEREAERTVNAFCSGMGKVPAGFTHMTSAIDFAVGPAAEVVISGDPSADDTREMVAALRRIYEPNMVVLLRPAGDAEAARALADIAGFTAGLDPAGGKAAAYVCRGGSCSLPATDPEEMVRRILDMRS